MQEIRAFRAEMEPVEFLPKERLFAFLDSILRNKEELARAGCPLGGLCAGSA